MQSGIPRRPIVQPGASAAAPTHQTTTNNAKAKQQLPLHLASFSSSKNSGGLSSSNLATLSTSSIGSVSTTSNNEPPPLHPKPHPRSSVLSSFKSSISASSLLGPVSNSSNSNSGGGQASWGQPSIKNSSSTSQVQQLLPLRLSEGTTGGGGQGSSKTSSLPRGVTPSRSISSISQLEQNNPSELPPAPAGRMQRHSGSGNPFATGYTDQPSNPSYLHGPVTGNSSSDRMNAYFSRPPAPLPPSHHQQQMYLTTTNGANLEVSHGTPTGVANPIIHRRSGSSPVPMTGAVTNNANNSRNSASHNHNHHRRFFQTQDDDFDSSKILFL